MTTRHELAVVIASSSMHPTDHSKLTQSVAAYLIQEKRSGELELVMRDVMDLRAKAGVVEVVVSSVLPLSVVARQQVSNIVKRHNSSAKAIIVQERRDTSIIGGVELEFAGKRIDMSVRGRLNHLKQLSRSSESTH